MVKDCSFSSIQSMIIRIVYTTSRLHLTEIERSVYPIKSQISHKFTPVDDVQEIHISYYRL